MYKVMIVDDEPVGSRHIQKIIEHYIENFVVSDIARNGKDAIEKLEKESVDVVITDIKMPAMDGIELAEYITEHNANIHIVIVSGYSDFAYAQSAIRLGVKDYLLKPIIPEDLQNLLKKIQCDLEKRRYEECKKIISRIYCGEKAEADEITYCFPDSGYYIALIRKNGLPYFPSAMMNFFSEIEEKIFLFGRDEMEVLYICPKECFTQEEFLATVLRNFEKSFAPIPYYTFLYTKMTVLPCDIPEIIHKIYLVLNEQLVLGENKKISISLNSQSEKKTDINENVIFSLFTKYCENRDIIKAKEQLHKIIKLCGEQQFPMNRLKSILYHACFLLEKYQLFYPGKDWIQGQVLEEALFYSENIDQLIKYIDDALWNGGTEKINLKLGAFEYYKLVVEYIQKHFPETITLQTASEKLGISRTYINKLLRKYNNETFISYLTKVRMEYAKELLKKSDEKLLIKDVAEQAGYEDGFVKFFV